MKPITKRETRLPDFSPILVPAFPTVIGNALVPHSTIAILFAVFPFPALVAALAATVAVVLVQRVPVRVRLPGWPLAFAFAEFAGSVAAIVFPSFGCVCACLGQPFRLHQHDPSPALPPYAIVRVHSRHGRQSLADAASALVSRPADAELRPHSPDSVGLAIVVRPAADAAVAVAAVGAVAIGYEREWTKKHLGYSGIGRCVFAAVVLTVCFPRVAAAILARWHSTPAGSSLAYLDSFLIVGSIDLWKIEITSIVD